MSGLVVAGTTHGRVGISKYRIYDIMAEEIIYESDWLEEKCSINICNFFAICTGIYLSETQFDGIPVYTDSRIAFAWVRDKKVRTTEKALKERIRKAELYLQKINVKVYKWNKDWGENPAKYLKG